MSIPEIPAAVNPAAAEPPVPEESGAPRELELALGALRDLDAPDLALAARPERLGGGFWAEMWTLRLAEHGPRLPDRVVLRLAPDASHAAWETTVQRGVAQQGYPTPAILAAGEATATTRFWSVMEHADGQPLLAGLSGVGALVRLPRLAGALPKRLAAAMTALHALDPDPIERDLTRITGRSVGVDGLLDHFHERARALDEPALTRAVEHLTVGRPAPSGRVVCHGDLHPFNMLDHDGATTVLDWTAAQIAEPAYDVAFTALLLANPPLAAPAALTPVINGAGRALSRRFVRAYRANSTDITLRDADLRWYTQLHAVRILVELTAWRVAGELEDHRGHPWVAMAGAVQRLIERR